MNGLIYMQYAEWAARPYIQPARIWLLLNRSDLKPASSGQREVRGWWQISGTITLICMFILSSSLRIAKCKYLKNERVQVPTHIRTNVTW